MAAPTGSHGWQCSDCFTQDLSLRYPSGKIRRCMDCQRFYNVTVNSRRSRAHQYSPQMVISRDDFVSWCRSSPRVCAYCEIPEADLPKIGIRSTIGLLVVALGVDRIDNGLDYSLGNIQMCCFACNKAKGNVFEHHEFGKHVGPAITMAWESRLTGALGRGLSKPHFGQLRTDDEHPVCRRCGLSQWPAAGTQCLGCAKYISALNNSKRARKLAAGPGMDLSRGDFLQWLRQQPPACAYCGVLEGLLPSLGIKTQVGHALKNLGLDRRNNDAGYSLGNLALCCYPCNKVKGNVFNDVEMDRYVGPAIGAVWTERLVAVNAGR